MVIAHEKITATVLAGGHGSRLGGCDKGLIEIDGRPLIEHILTYLTPQVDEIIINANRHIEQYSRYRLPVVADSWVNCGPLAGVLAALESARNSAVLCVPCDAIRLPPNLVKRLHAGFNNNQLEACVVHDGRRLQPVCCLLRRCLEKRLRRFIERGGRAVRCWLATLRWETADFSDWPPSFWSVNTPLELQRLQYGFNV